MKVNELKAAMDAQFEEVKAQFAGVDERFTTIDKRFEAMDRCIISEAEATRRHFDVVAEDLKSDIRLLAGAVATVSSTLEHHVSASLSERTTVSAALDDHEVRLTVLERRRL